MRWVRGFGAWALLAAGCAGPALTTPRGLPPLLNGPTGAAPAPAELSPDNAAVACLTTAETYEKATPPREAEAIVLYEKARQFNPRLGAKAGRRLAVLYDRQGNYAKALTEYQQLLQANPRDDELLNDLGCCHYHREEWAEAEHCLRQAVEANPQNLRAWNNLGKALGQLQRYPEALAAFTRAVGPAQGQCNLAFIYSTQGQHGKAREAWQKALELEPALQVARAALAKLDAADRKAVPPPEGADPERPRPPADRSAALTRLVNFVRDQEGQAPSSANGPDTAAAPTLSVAPKTEDAAETRPTPRKRTVIKPIPVPCSP